MIPELPSPPRPGLGALADDLRRSPAGPELAVALARRNAIVATAAEHGAASARELVALETGVFDSRASRQPGPSPGAVAALRQLDRWGVRASDTKPSQNVIDAIAPTNVHDSTDTGPDSPDATARTSVLVQRLADLHDLDRARIDTLGKAAASSHRVHRAMERWPIASVTRIIDATGLQVQAVTSSLHRLRGLGIVREITRRHRHRLYTYDAWLALLDADVERALSERGGGR